jgi:methionyl aminopeptidase
MAVTLKSQREIDMMRRAGAIAAEALRIGGEAVRPGVTTKQINDIMHKFIKSKNAIPNFLGYGGFPGVACISVNDEVIHGIPSGRVLTDGDIVSIDVGVLLNGYHSDTAATFPCGNVSDEAKKLIEVTRQCFYEGLQFVREGYRLGDVGNAISTYAHKHGFSVVRDYIGHGVGTQLHEEPDVPNYGVRGKGLRLQKGMTIAIEPMINAGSYEVQQIHPNGWTVTTKDGRLSAHYEHTVAVTDNEPLILTSQS